MTIPSRYYDPFIVDSLVQRYPVPGASFADRCEAARRLSAKGWTASEIGAMFGLSGRNVERLMRNEVEEMPPPPDWAHEDKDRDWPRCANGHELTPDNIFSRKDHPDWKSCLQCRQDSTRANYKARQLRYKERHSA